jgi:hypothetical protein
VLGERHPDTLTAIGNLADSLRTQKKYDEAAVLERQVLAQISAALGSEHPSSMIAILNLAETLSKMGEHDEVGSLSQPCTWLVSLTLPWMFSLTRARGWFTLSTFHVAGSLSPFRG